MGTIFSLYKATSFFRKSPFNGAENYQKFKNFDLTQHSSTQQKGRITLSVPQVSMLLYHFLFSSFHFTCAAVTLTLWFPISTAPKYDETEFNFADVMKRVWTNSSASERGFMFLTVRRSACVIFGLSISIQYYLAHKKRIR